MTFKNPCIIVLCTKVALAMEGLIIGLIDYGNSRRVGVRWKVVTCPAVSIWIPSHRYILPCRLNTCSINTWSIRTKIWANDWRENVRSHDVDLCSRYHWPFVKSLQNWFRFFQYAERLIKRNYEILLLLLRSSSPTHTLNTERRSLSRYNLSPSEDDSAEREIFRSVIVADISQN